MTTTVSEIATRIAELEHQLERALAKEVDVKRREFFYVIEKGKVAFESEARAYRKELAKLRAELKP